MTLRRTFVWLITATLNLLLNLLLPSIALAKYIGCDRPVPNVSLWVADRTGIMVSLTEGNLIERRSVCGSGCATCGCSTNSDSDTHGVRFTATYNSRDADGSHAQLDTVMGYGWT